MAWLARHGTARHSVLHVLPCIKEPKLRPCPSRICSRFQQVYVDQPSVTDTISILRGLRER